MRSPTGLASPQPPHPPFDHARLVRVCAYFSGDPHAAQDLAQETLLEAWHNAHKLYADTHYDAWLTGIARNVCLRWARRRGREWARVEPFAAEAAEADPPDHALDLEVALERDELATLLDRALALLPAETRSALIERYIHDSSLAEVAGRLGLSEGNVAVRLHRGKLALRRILATELQAEAEALGLVASVSSLQPTRLWCPTCGQRQLVGRLDAAAGDLRLQCPHCLEARGITFRNTRGLPHVFNGAKGFRVALTRSLKWSERIIQRSLRDGVSACAFCGRPVRPRILTSALGYHWDASCSACPSVNRHHLSNRLLASDAGLRFWRNHPRLRRLPDRDMEAEGAATILTGWESVTSLARLEFLVARNTFDIVRLVRHG